MIRQKYVDEYIELYRSGKVKFNNERELLIEYLEKYVLNRDDLYFDDEMIEKCIRFGEKWYFPLQSFQKFLIAFVFYFIRKMAVYFIVNSCGCLAVAAVKWFNDSYSSLLISELHGIPEYNISVVANSEEQAKTSPDEIHKCIKRNEVLQRAFKTTLTQTISKSTGSVVKFRTSNGIQKMVFAMGL